MTPLPCPSTGPDYRGHGPDARPEPWEATEHLSARDYRRLKREWLANLPDESLIDLAEEQVDRDEAKYANAIGEFYIAGLVCS